MHVEPFSSLAIQQIKDGFKGVRCGMFVCGGPDCWLGLGQENVQRVAYFSLSSDTQGADFCYWNVVWLHLRALGGTCRLTTILGALYSKHVEECRKSLKMKTRRL